MTKKPGTWKALRRQLDQLHRENGDLADRVRSLEQELAGAVRARNYTGEQLEKYKRRHDETTIALGGGTRIANYTRLLDPSELAPRISTAQALGNLVLVRLVEDERDGSRFEMWAHPMMCRTVV